MSLREVTFAGGGSQLSALLQRPRGATALLALAHGAGAGMAHPFLQALADRLAAQGIATFRYQFPYMEEGRKRPDPPRRAVAAVRAAAAAARAAAPRLPLFAGGKSFGGRMTTTAAGESLPAVRGLALFGFPLHAPGREGIERAAHLADVDLPMLFLQGTRDKLANLELLRPVLDELGPRAALHVVDGADHGFYVLKRSGRTHGEVLDELAGTFAAWARPLSG